MSEMWGKVKATIVSLTLTAVVLFLSLSLSGAGNMDRVNAAEAVAIDLEFSKAADEEQFEEIYRGWKVSDGKFMPSEAWASTNLSVPISFKNEAVKISFDYSFTTNLVVGLAKDATESVSSTTTGIGAFARMEAGRIALHTSVESTHDQWLNEADGAFNGQHKVELVYKPEKTLTVKIDGNELKHSNGALAPLTDVEFGSKYDFDEGWLVLKSQDADTYIDNLKITGGEVVDSEDPLPPEPDDDEEIFDEPIDYKLSVFDYKVQKHPNDPANDYWMGAPDDHNAYVTAPETQEANPGNGYATAICFTAPADGMVIPRDGNIGWAYIKDSKLSDGVRVSLFVNNNKIFPVENKTWQKLNGNDNEPVKLTAEAFEMKKGDKLFLVFENGGKGNSDYDTVKYMVGFDRKDAAYPDSFWFDSTKSMEEGTVKGGGWILASDGDSNYIGTTYKKRDLLSYHYAVVQECFPIGEAQEITKQAIENVSSEELIYSELDQRWYHPVDANCYAFPNKVDPGARYALGIHWTAPKDGRVDISKSYVENFSYKAQPDGGGIKSNGVRVCVLLNEKEIIYPASSTWQTLGNADRLYFNLPVFEVKSGDTLIFVLDCNNESNYDECYYDVTIKFAENDAKFTEIYNNVADFFLSSDQTAWKYMAMDFIGNAPVDPVEPLPIIDFGSGVGNNIPLIVGLSIGGAIIVIAAGVGIAVWKKSKVNREERRK